MVIGILGLQGCVAPHHKKLAALGVTEIRRVIYPHDLDGVDGLIMPGGESTTMIKTAKDGLWDALVEFGQARTVWGICAGSILMAKKVEHPAQASLGLMDMSISRNAYGSQIDSFIAKIPMNLGGEEISESCIFIRAPRILSVGESVRIVAEHAGSAIMVESDRHLATTFHPELSDSDRLHAYFLDKVKAQNG